MRSANAFRPAAYRMQKRYGGLYRRTFFVRRQIKKHGGTKVVYQNLFGHTAEDNRGIEIPGGACDIKGLNQVDAPKKLGRNQAADHGQPMMR